MSLPGRAWAIGSTSWWLAHPDAMLPSYQLYVVGGAILALRLGDLTAWVRRHRFLVAPEVCRGSSTDPARRGHGTGLGLAIARYVDPSRVTFGEYLDLW